MERLFQDVPMEQRAEMLRDNCYKVVDGEVYQKPLTEEELEAYKKDLVDTTIRIERDKAELKEVSKEYKQRIKENEKVRREAAEAIKYGSVTIEGKAYYMDNQEEGMMEIYSEDGVLVSKRPLLPEERQLSIMTVKTGTEN